MNVGRLLALGGLGALVFNLMFPRASDPWDATSVLTMMAEHAWRRQVAFVGVTLSVWLIAGSLVELGLRTRRDTGRWGAGLVGLGTAAFTVASALGLAATGPARTWSGGDRGIDTEFLAATVLNRADDFTWFIAITALWAGMGLVGLAFRHDLRVAGVVLAFVGLVTAIGAGLPLLIGLESPALLVGFGVMASLTAMWALVVGVGLMRVART